MTLARPPTILCVDDEAGALTLRKLLLEQAGYTVLSAPDAATALQLFKSQTIHLVISDHLLPDLSGCELTREMKRQRPFVPIMLFSGVTEPPAEAGHADSFTCKGDGPVELLAKVADLLRCNRISEGSYFAEIRCDKRFDPIVWHYTIQLLRSLEILAWSQAGSEKAAIQTAKGEMRRLNRESRTQEAAVKLQG